MSAYRIETWTKKGFTEEEAKFQIAIRRPSNILYWINKGFTEEEAALKLNGHQSLGGTSSAARPLEEKRKTSKRCKEYWIERGFSEEESINKVSELQNTFSKESCIKKFGDDEGIKKFNERQEKWQNTLNSKTDEEKQIINNKKKNHSSYESYLNRGFTEEEAKKEMKEYFLRNNYLFFETRQEFENHVLSEFKKDPFLYFWPLDLLTKRFSIPKSKFVLWNKKFDVEEWLKNNIKLKNTSGEMITKRSSNWSGTGCGHYVMWTKKGTYLRSSNEIYFYQLLEEMNFKEGEDYIIEKYYPNSRMRCDFYFIESGVWVELAGSKDEKYIQKMLFKKDTWGSNIIYEKEHYFDFINNLK
jgi:hypothetical protein